MLYQDSETLFSARAKYLHMNGLPPDGGVTDKWARYKFGSRELVAYPNFQHRAQALARHDLHHIVNNLDTTSLGEGLIAAWELGSGCGRYWISWCMEPQALWWGILMAPRKTFGLFLRGRHSRNLFHEAYSEDLLSKTVGELRELLLPKANLPFRATLADVFVFLGVAILGLMMIALFIPTVMVFSLIGGVDSLLKRTFGSTPS